MNQNPQQSSRKFSWQQNIRKIPQSILAKIETLLCDSVIVATAIKIPESQIKAGDYKHIGITFDNEEIHVEQGMLPDQSIGHWSKVNLHGKKIIRNDLPKVHKEFFVESPNYGDWSKGSHEISFFIV